MEKIVKKIPARLSLLALVACASMQESEGPPNALQPGLTQAELLKALEGGKALRAARLSFRFWQ